VVVLQRNILVQPNMQSHEGPSNKHKVQLPFNPSVNWVQNRPSHDTSTQTSDRDPILGLVISEIVWTETKENEAERKRWRKKLGEEHDDSGHCFCLLVKQFCVRISGSCAHGRQFLTALGVCPLTKGTTTEWSEVIPEWRKIHDGNFEIHGTNFVRTVKFSSSQRTK
jgi:hypothetical protein